MLDNLKGMTALAGMMKDLPRIKARLEEVRERLEQTRVEAETGGGAVRATASGHLRLVAIDVDPALLSALVDADVPEDRAMATELIVGAVNAALQKSREEAADQMREAAADLGLPLPPGVVDSLLGS